ncbi:AraC family transcriptional regulator [Acidaminobacter sp. JC074]|uniref:AraC family transcriptional regulator n=1 Tax=Acidaminobacter sp. JC074 TaxID=2530199 RepID=UPI001F114609|nr:AraC family transcriptional regulator [Acidaminobacter sp. JC074]MCH4889631.1 AraC family transcriptional regulator [Acidaminobacter sp. JC074]
MNWFKALNDSLSYVEENILKDIDYDQVAKIALCSKYHFLRTFKALTDMNLSEYVRLRRLSLSVTDLTTSKDKIIDIAYKYGYETPESFSKAFKKLHGVSPSKVRNQGYNLKAVPPLSFKIEIKGAYRMNYRIERKEAFNLVGFSKDVTSKNGENFMIIPAFWQECMANGSFEQLMAGKETSYGVCYGYDSKVEEFKYLIAVDGNTADLEDTVVLKVPEATYAVFEAKGPLPHKLQEVTKQVYNEWFPATNYEHAMSPEFELYLPGNPQADDYVCELWIPVVEK